MGKRRKSEVVPMFNIHPEATSSTAKPSLLGTASAAVVAQREVARLKRMGQSFRAVTPDAASKPPLTPHPELPATAPTGNTRSSRNLNQLARSVISMQKAQKEIDAVLDSAPVSNQAETTSQAPDPWGNVLQRVLRKTPSFRTNLPTTSEKEKTTTQSKRTSLAQMLKSREVKALVKQAVVANHWHHAALDPSARNAGGAEIEYSTVMEHWIKTAELRKQSMMGDGEAVEDTDDENDVDLQYDPSVMVSANGVKSGFDLRDSGTSSMYGRTLLLEESCRRAFAQPGENRTAMDLQALKAWFQMTKLKITTDFERLQPAELDLLCRRMTLVRLHSNEIVFRQGDEGDAMYIVFAGVVEVRVGQRILGEKVEVTVCELTKGDYFGERALLNNDPRAATIVARTGGELVKITRKDYNIMLKTDQQAFLSRMQLTNGLLLTRKASMGQTHHEYIKVLSKKPQSRSKIDIDMLSEYLHTLKFFRGLPGSFVRELCTVVDFVTFPQGSYVFREGEVGDLFYVIFSGSVDVIVSSQDAKGQTQQTKLINLTEGSHFGELALMKGHGIRSATVRTREECKLLVICENDYNATLRRMQREDLAKRVGVLDHIPMFQTPEWTGELLKEMSYVLAEQRLASGAVLFEQGEKAQHVYFVVRGELLVTKGIVEPGGKTHHVLVERVGRFRVIGDDAAAGATFNEVIYREVTVTASTPVEVLVLSKYDVFHRLSRSARETLRAAAHSHVESVVYLDRFHKTEKWKAYKKSLVQECVKHPSSPVTKPKHHKKAKTPRRNESELDALPTKGEKIEEEQEKRPDMAHLPPLVDANEFLLLEREKTVMNKCFGQEQTFAHHVVRFNADAPPTEARARDFDSVVNAERQRQVEILNEGNPLAYFDMNTVYAEQRQQQAVARSRAASSRRLLIRGTSGSDNSGGSSHQLGSTDTRRGSAAERAATNVLNYFVHENFIFSHPETHEKEEDVGGRSPSRRREKQRAKRKQKRRRARQGSALGSLTDISPRRSNDERRRTSVRASTPVQPSTHEKKLCDGDLVLICVLDHDEEENDQDEIEASPPFRLVRALPAMSHAKDAMLHHLLNDLSDAGRQELIDGLEPFEATSTTYHVMEKRKFGLLPSKTPRPRHVEEALQRSVADRFTATVPKGDGDGGTPGGVLPADPMTLFASSHNVAMPLSEQREAAMAHTKRSHDAQLEGTSKALSGSPARCFAVVSMVLSRREVANAFCDEPFLSIHSIYPSETEAMQAALLLPPQPLKNALVCIVPLNEWIHFEDAFEWCIQNEADRSDKQSLPRLSTPSTPRRTPTGSSGPSMLTPRRKTGSVCNLNGALMPHTAAAEKVKARRLHQFICARLGVKEKADPRRPGLGEAPPTGFTPKPTITLEHKLAALEEYLESAQTSPGMGGKSTTLMNKYRQMKRIGSIMRSRANLMGSSPSSPSSSTTVAVRKDSGR